MQAYKCDKCGKFVEGAPEIQVKTNKIIIAINYTPDGNGENWYIHDLCPECSEAFKAWWCKDR